MRTSRLVISVLAGILFTFVFASGHTAMNSAEAARVAAAPQSSSVLIADGSDPLPRPHKRA